MRISWSIVSLSGKQNGSLAQARLGGRSQFHTNFSKKVGRLVQRQAHDA